MGDRFTMDQGDLLLNLARGIIAQDLAIQVPDSKAVLSDLTAHGFLDEAHGLFVTLHKAGKLRGCIGTIEPLVPLRDGIRENARHAAFRDRRFQPLARDEFDLIDIEVSILSCPRPLAYDGPEDLVDKLTPFEDGVILEKGRHRATFLPQVWEQLPSPEAFLSQLCLKAGLASDAWETRNLDISVYNVQSFSETGRQRPSATQRKNHEC